MPQLLIIADDLTGAADAASYFAQQRFGTAVLLRENAMVDADVVSFSTNTRDLPEAAAIPIVERAAAVLLRSDPAIVYKKIDSALRGHPGAELAAVARARPGTSIVVAPALPGEGRTTVNGRQHVAGVPVEQTAFAAPGATSYLAEAIGAWFPRIDVCALGLGSVRESDLQIRFRADEASIFLCDAETDDDLDAIAKAAIRDGIRLLCGSAGLARALERTSAVAPVNATPPLQRRTAAPVLVIAGTRHEATARQIAEAESAGAVVIRPPQALLDEPERRPCALARAIGEHLDAGRDVILTTSGCETCSCGGARIADLLARVLDETQVLDGIGGLVLTGGDIAAAAARRLGADAIWLRGEVQPAIPWGTFVGGRLPGLPVVTKAGSFGRPDALSAAIAMLKGPLK